MRTRPLILGLAFALIASPVVAAIRVPDEPLVWTVVPRPGPSGRVDAPVHGDAATADVWGAVPSMRPSRHVPAVVGVHQGIRADVVGTAGGGVAGVASWYCGHGSPCTHGYGPDCLCAAAGPALRVGNWRGRTVLVSAGGRRISVRLVDWCLCTGGSGRLLDLFSGAFSRLAPLSRGLVKVTVTY